LPRRGRYLLPEQRLSTVSAGVTRPSSLLLAHAPGQHPPLDFGFPYFDRSLQVATSPCWTMALPDVISAVLAQAPGSVPRHDRAVLVSVTSHSASASPEGQEDRLVKHPATQLSAGEVFRGCNHSLMFRLLCLLGPLAAQTVRARCPCGLRAVYTGLYPRRCRSRAPASLRVRIRTIDTTGLVRATARTHLLDRSLVGCS
jgi:hypothetical protein